MLRLTLLTVAILSLGPWTTVRGGDSACCGTCESATAKCAATTAPTTAPSAANKFCPVHPEINVDPQATCQHDGKTLAFCCHECIKVFQKNPDKYTKNIK